MGKNTYLQQMNYYENQYRADDFLPCSMFQPNKIYLDFGNKTRILQNLAKYDIKKCENLPHRIHFIST